LIVVLTPRRPSEVIQRRRCSPVTEEVGLVASIVDVQTRLVILIESTLAIVALVVRLLVLSRLRNPEVGDGEDGLVVGE
jgi:hypothetical protein